MERNLESAITLARAVREAESALDHAVQRSATLARAAMTWHPLCDPQKREHPIPTTKERDTAMREHKLASQVYKQAVSDLLDFLVQKDD